MADLECPEGCSQESSVVMQVSMESNMSLLSSHSVYNIEFEHFPIWGFWKGIEKNKGEDFVVYRVFHPSKTGFNCSEYRDVFRDSGGPIPCTTKELLEKVEGGEDVWSFVECHEGVKESLGAGLLMGLH